MEMFYQFLVAFCCLSSIGGFCYQYNGKQAQRKNSFYQKIQESKNSLGYDVEVELENLYRLPVESLLSLAKESFPLAPLHRVGTLEREELIENILHEKLSNLSRKEIINTARLYYKGDLRKPTSFLCEKIIEEVKRLKMDESSKPVSSEVSSPPSEVSSEFSLDEEEQEVLKEQGLHFEDLLQLQVQFQQRGPSYFLKEKPQLSRKRFASSAERKANARLGPKDTAASRKRQQLVQEIFYNDSSSAFPPDNLTASSLSNASREPLVITDNQLEQLPRRRNLKEIPDLGRLLTAPPKDILQGVTLQMMVEELVAKCGYQRLFHETHLRFLQDQPSLSSVVKALRGPKMDWARKKIERFYVRVKQEERKEARRSSTRQ